MQDINKQIATSYSEDLGTAIGAAKGNVQYQEKVRAYDSGLSSMAAALQRKYKVDLAEEKQEEREQKASDSLTAELRAMAGEPLPDNSSETTKTTHAAVTYMKEVSQVVNMVVPTLRSATFSALPKEKQEEYIATIREGIADNIPEQLVDNAGVKRYAIAQYKAIDVAVAAARDNYENVILPTETIGTTVDMLIIENADVKTWTEQLEIMQSPTVIGSMPKQDVVHLIYGETIRALESGNIDVFTAVRNSDLYKSMGTEQKKHLKRAHITAQGKQQAEIVDSTIESTLAILRSVASGADQKLFEDSMVDVLKLPPKLRNQVMDRVEPARRRALNILNVSRKVDVRRTDGYIGDPMSKEDVNIAFELATNEAMNTSMDEQGRTTINIQQAQQAAAVANAKVGIYSDQTKVAYNLTNPSFIEDDQGNKQLDLLTRLALEGAFNIRTKLSKSQVYNILGEENATQFNRIMTLMERGYTPSQAVSKLMEKKERHGTLSITDKARKELDKVTEIAQGGFFDTIGDDFLDNVLIQAVAIVLPNPFRFTQTQLENEQSKETDLYATAPLNEEGVDSGNVPQSVGVLRKFAVSNRYTYTIGFIAHQKTLPDASLDEQITSYNAKLEASGIISNNVLILNERLGEKLRTAVGGDQLKANKYLSLTSQALAPMAVLDIDTRRAIEDDVTVIGRKAANGTITPVTDATIRQTLLRSTSRPADIVVSVDIERYNELYENGGTLANGIEIPSIRDELTDLGGSFDTRAVFGRFAQHSIDYDDNTGSFGFTMYNTSGDILLSEESRSPRSTLVNGVTKESFDRPVGTPMQGSISAEFIMLFMQQYAREEEKR